MPPLLTVLAAVLFLVTAPIWLAWRVLVEAVYLIRVFALYPMVWRRTSTSTA